MITVKLIGGAKKPFSTDKLELDKDGSTILELLDFLQQRIPKNMPHLDVNNILVAVNGVDSSTLKGFETHLKNGDIVSIIPVIHGGSYKRTQFRIFDTTVDILAVKPMDDPIGFLDHLRQKYANLVIQGINSHYVLNLDHAKKVIAISLAAQKSDDLLSNKIETDMLMRFSCTKQINEAIKKVGLQRKQDFVLITIGKKLLLDKLCTELKTYLKPAFSSNNSAFLKKEFGISVAHLKSIVSQTPLEDLLAEKAAVLFR